MRCLFPLAAAAAAILVIGCDTRPTASPEKLPEEVRTLLDTYGMTEQTIVDEADAAQTDCILPPVTDTGYAVYSGTFIWGRLLAARGAPSATTDWSGSLCVSGAEGAVKAICPIDFEEGEDFVLPAGDTRRASWVSITAGDFDGLGFLVRVRESSASLAVQPRLVFETAPLSVELPVPKLDCFAEYFPVGGAEGAAVIARRVKGNACPRGFMKGEWAPDVNVGDCGCFNGMWYDLFGVPVGTMSGSFGTDNGARWFKGWLSGVYLTVVLAEFEGAWSYDDPRVCAVCGEGHGRVEGKFRYLDCKRTGVMLGEFGDVSTVAGSTPEKRSLPLKGIWRASCPSFDDRP